jgi:hypothetical protein
MMTKKMILGAAMLGLLSINCAGVTSGQPTTASVTGDTWYTKDHYLVTKLITTGSDVYYCPKEAPSKCVKAELKD